MQAAEPLPRACLDGDHSRSHSRSHSHSLARDAADAADAAVAVAVASTWLDELLTHGRSQVSRLESRQSASQSANQPTSRVNKRVAGVAARTGHTHCCCCCCYVHLCSQHKQQKPQSRPRHIALEARDSACMHTPHHIRAGTWKRCKTCSTLLHQRSSQLWSRPGLGLGLGPDGWTDRTCSRSNLVALLSWVSLN